MNDNRSMWFILYAVFGLYFVNSALSFISLPGFFADIDKWILLIGGLLLLWGGVRYYKRQKIVY